VKQNTKVISKPIIQRKNQEIIYRYFIDFNGLTNDNRLFINIIFDGDNFRILIGQKRRLL